MKQKEFFDLAHEMVKECGDWENSEGMSEQKKAALIAKVEQMDREAEQKGTPKEKSGKVFRLKKRYLVVLAAALVLLLGTGVVGDRAWISEDKSLGRETEVTTKVNNEEKDSVLREEEEIYREIVEKLGIVPMWLGRIPDGMNLDSYVIMEDSGWASIFYLYDDEVVSIKMTRVSEESSSNEQWDGASRKLENVTNAMGYEIDAYCVDEEYQNYAASLTYGNGYYNIFGTFSDEEEFLSILERIYFKSL